jgi:TonB family protein
MSPFRRRNLAVQALFLALIAMFVPVGIASQDHSESARKIIARITPQYPPIARSLRIQGGVKADVLVEPNGTVKAVEIKGGHPLLVQSAQAALREWKWEPAPHETHESVELKFTL